MFFILSTTSVAFSSFVHECPGEKSSVIKTSELLPLGAKKTFLLCYYRGRRDMRSQGCQKFREKEIPVLLLSGGSGCGETG